MRRLPPLTQLRAFEAAARHRSFKAAAEELSVTPAAVSHQIRELEDRLGLRLFERRTRQVVPTAAALALYPVLRDGFDAFAEAIESLTRQDASALTLSATPAFVSQWLLPRLGEFRRAHPGIDLRLHASPVPVDLAGGGADLAVRYGFGPYPSHEVAVLSVDRFQPVASPSLGLASPAELARHRLIHFDWSRDLPERPTWPLWLRRARLRHPDAQRGLRFSEESHAIQAAIAGQGVALLGATLIRDELRRGVLVAPFGPSLDGPRYHLLRHRARPPGDAAHRVWQWLTAAFAAEADARPHAAPLG